jgi:hypothetical protein
MKKRSLVWLLGGAALLPLASGCGVILGLDKFEEGKANSGGAGGGAGAGGNKPLACAPGDIKACPYTGPGATENKGVCKAGTQTCAKDGSGFEACAGEVLPTTEDCTTPADEDCDGTPNQASAGCLCAPDAMEACYDGAPGTAGVGLCVKGTHTCAKDGKSWGTCTGQVLPVAEDCTTDQDDNCDGASNEGCKCSPGVATACYTGAAGTQNNGACVGGMWTCNADGLGYGPCVGEVLPVAEDCTTVADDDCDGVPNQASAGCVCAPGTTMGCYSGPIATKMVGACKDGTATCAADGKAYGTCSGDVVPAASDDCSNAVDEDCTGTYCTQFVWNKSAASTAAITDLVTDAAGNTYVTGFFSGSLPLKVPALTSSGSFDGFAAKIDPAGNVVWNIQFGDVLNQFGRGIALDSMGNVILVGYFTRSVTFGTTTLGGLTNDTDQIFVAKLDNAGNAIWVKQYGDPVGGSIANQEGYAVAVDPLDNIVFVGQFKNQVDLGMGLVAAKGNTDAFVARLDKAGTTTYAKTFGGAGSTVSSTRVAVDSAGNAALIGSFTATVNFGFSSPTTANAAGSDAFLLRVSTTGSSSWLKTFGNAKAISFNDVKIDGASNVVLAGGFQGTVTLGTKVLTVPNAGSNPFVAQYDPTGLVKWAIQVGNTVANAGGSSAIGSLGIGPSGEVLLAGSCYSAFDVGFPLACTSATPFLLMTSSAGVPGWGRTYGAGGVSFPSFTAAPFAVVAGNSNGALNFGLGVQPTGLVVGKVATK